MEKFTFFYRTQNVFSQWHPCRFTIEGIEYNSAEQYMMQQKALLFGDTETAEKIMLKSEPRDQKALGRQVAGFDWEIWEVKAKEIVYKANHAKFTQNETMLKQLLATEGTTLVEASPSDTVWGIGYTEDHPNALNRNTWRGTNWLGEVLTQLRADLIGKMNTNN